MQNQEGGSIPSFENLKITDADAAAAAAAEYKAKKDAFDIDAANIKIGEKPAAELRAPMDAILGAPNDVVQIPIANFKVHKVKPGNAKGVLGFQNTTVGEDTYTQLVFKPFDKDGNATITNAELIPQPLLNLNGEGNSIGAKERKMTSNMIANIADRSYEKNADGKIVGKDDIPAIKNAWYEEAQNAFQAGPDGKGVEVFGQKMAEVGAKLVGGKSKKRRIQRRKSVRRRRMSNRKR